MKNYPKTVIYDLYIRRGLSLAAASKEAGCSIPTFSAYMRKYKIKARPFSRKKDKRRIQTIRTLRKTGLTYREIGEVLSLSRQRVHQILAVC